MGVRRAIIGDIHGCITELRELLSLLQSEGIEEIYHLGDLVDRGPDSLAVIRLCRELGLKGVMGNHESSLLALYDRSRSPDFQSQDLPREKRNKWEIAKAMSPEDLGYIRSLPKLHLLEDENLVLVHGGLWPKRSLAEQDRSVLYLRVIHPDRPGEVRWMEKPGHYTLEESRKAGFAPWYEIYDGSESVVYGHTVVDQPRLHGRTIGIDTGCVYGGSLTAYVLPEREFRQVKAKASYARRSGS